MNIDNPDDWADSDTVRARLREVRESASKGFETRERPSKNFSGRSSRGNPKLCISQLYLVQEK